MVLFQVLFLDPFLMPLSVDVEFQWKKQDKQREILIFRRARRGFFLSPLECCEVENDDETKGSTTFSFPHSYQIIRSNLNINNGLVLLYREIYV